MVPVQEVHSSSCSVSKRRMQTENKIDKTITTADITNSTSVMMTSVADDTAAIGYISLGSLDDSVKAVKIDGAEASAENVSNGSYKVSRPFNIATKGTPNEVTQDLSTSS